MSGVRDGRFDVAIVSGPRLAHWPSVGVRILSAFCAEMGLQVGVFGGSALHVRGVIPLFGTGGIILAEDVQGRVHRIRARAVVRLSPPSAFWTDFEGWHSSCVLPLATAMKLFATATISWSPATVILGTGNPALRLGSALLERNACEVYCLEFRNQWGGKDYAAWEVEKRHFEILGGKILHARPVKLSQKSPLLWEFRVEDSLGTRVLEIGRLIMAGPFEENPGVREYPAGSLLFELDQTAAEMRSEDIEGYLLEEERGRLLATRIVKALSPVQADKEEMERAVRRARGRLKSAALHQEIPFAPTYRGKWMDEEPARQLRQFAGIPKQAQKSRLVAALECVEPIPCNLCEKSCPESAIQITRQVKGAGVESFLHESDCTACGACLPVCPSHVAVLMKEEETRSFSQLVLFWKGSIPWQPGEFATLLNRKGDALGTARVAALLPFPGQSADGPGQLVQVDVPTHLIWEARGLRRPNQGQGREEHVPAAFDLTHSAAQITLNGEKRLVRAGVSISVGLFEMGKNRVEDALLCPDGSCGLCQLYVDGIKKLACKTITKQGMVIRIAEGQNEFFKGNELFLCSCEKISREEVLRRIRQGRLRSVESVLSAAEVGEGTCHGQVCCAPLRRLMEAEGIDAKNWIDWRFPWMDWTQA